MPRKGRGSKVQPVKTSGGQAYGQTKVQKEAQAVAPLPQVVEADIVERPARSGLRPGQMGSPFRDTERPGEPIQTPTRMSPAEGPPLSHERAVQLPKILHVLYALTNNPYADPGMQDMVRRMEQFVPPNPRSRP
tara:strand:- start:11376 stop:11777 length:402 start_codon:yes stop_codon:yes gene_type:complete